MTSLLRFQPSLEGIKKTLSALAVSSLLAACGGGSSSSHDSGELAIALTDAEGDFLAYEVRVLSIELQKANGTTVETVPLSTDVDFAQYTDMTEFFTVATVPSGIYTGATLRLDYSNAEIVIENAEGEAVEATAVDADGNPITIIEMTVQLNDAQPLTIVPGIPANMMIDFDLKASNEILSYAPAKVEVDSYLVADLEFDAEREHRARGLLQSVDVDGDSFVIDLRPFRHRDGKFGQLDVSVTETTAYEIDGVHHEGDAGLTALALLAENTPLVAQGLVSLVDGKRIFTAAEVYAGSSVVWSDKDAIKGAVIARDGNTLTVKGRYIDHTDGSLRYHSAMTVTLAEQTHVTRQALTNEGVTIDSVSVGQEVLVLGAGSMDENGAVTLDASEGHLRMLVSTVIGEIETLSPLTLDVARMNACSPTEYDFTGTGVDAANDADPDAYEIDTQSLTLDDLGEGELIGVKGFVAPFGTAPEDFIAQTVINPRAQPMAAGLIIKWGRGATNPFSSIATDALVIDPAGARKELYLAGKHYDTDLNDTDDQMYTVVPSGDEGRYAIKARGQRSIQMYDSFADFTDALTAALDQGSIKQILVKGRYDLQSSTLYTSSVHVLMW